MSTFLKIPDPEDASGFFIPTLNKTGYAVTRMDEFSCEFVEYGAAVKGKMLEIGAGYGLTTLAALSRGVEVFCNDIEPRHLDIIRQLASNYPSSLLTMVPGSFPDDLNFPENFFDGILISRVLHFFPGEVIEPALRKIYRWLKPGGKIFVVVDTPYLKNFEKFIPEYERRVKEGEKWPGLIPNLSAFFGTPTYNLSSLANLMDLPILSRTLTETNFKIEKICRMNRTDYPEDRRYDGRESVGAIAQKPIL